MTRRKVKLEFITNESTRKATFKKRKNGLLKKVSELSTLCGIEACAIVYSEYDSQPDVWPSTLGAQKVLSKFTERPELEQSKKMVNQESLLKQGIRRTKERVKKLRIDNQQKKISQVMFEYLGSGMVMHDMSLVDLNDLGRLVQQNLQVIDERLEAISNEDSNS